MNSWHLWVNTLWISSVNTATIESFPSLAATCGISLMVRETPFHSFKDSHQMCQAHKDYKISLGWSNHLWNGTIGLTLPIVQLKGREGLFKFIIIELCSLPYVRQRQPYKWIDLAFDLAFIEDLWKEENPHRLFYPKNNETIFHVQDYCIKIGVGWE